MRINLSRVCAMEAAAEAEQLILVAGRGTRGELVLLDRMAHVWRQALTAPAFLGRNGLGKEREGDGKTPVGVFSLARPFGSKADPGCALPYLRVTGAHYWVSDPVSRWYNCLVSAGEVERDWQDAERLADYTDAYAYAAVIGYNPDCVPGKGSAIFLHCATGNPTAGCVAVPEDAMARILRMLRPGCRVVIDTPEHLLNH